jgi:hypothetical protein
MNEYIIKLDEDIGYDFELLAEKLGSASKAANELIRRGFSVDTRSQEEKDKEYEEYFNPFNMKRLAESEGKLESGDVLEVSFDELSAMENGPIPERIVRRVEELGWNTGRINK